MKSVIFLLALFAALLEAGSYKERPKVALAQPTTESQWFTDCSGPSGCKVQLDIHLAGMLPEQLSLGLFRPASFRRDRLIASISVDRSDLTEGPQTMSLPLDKLNTKKPIEDGKYYVAVFTKGFMGSRKMLVKSKRFQVVRVGALVKKPFVQDLQVMRPSMRSMSLNLIFAKPLTSRFQKYTVSLVNPKTKKTYSSVVVKGPQLNNWVELDFPHEPIAETTILQVFKNGWFGKTLVFRSRALTLAGARSMAECDCDGSADCECTADDCECVAKHAIKECDCDGSADCDCTDCECIAKHAAKGCDCDGSADCDCTDCECITKHTAIQTSTKNCVCDGSDLNCDCKECECVSKHTLAAMAGSIAALPATSTPTCDCEECNCSGESLTCDCEKCGCGSMNTITECTCDGTDPSCECEDGKCACVATHDFNQCKCDGTDPSCSCKDGQCDCVAPHAFDNSCACEGSDPFCKECTAGLVKTSRMSKSMKKRLRKAARAAICKCDGTDPSCKCEDEKCVCVATHNFNQCNCDGTDPSCECEDGKCACIATHNFNQCKCDGTDPSCECEDGKCACIATHNFNQCKCDGTDPSCECEDGKCACIASHNYNQCKCDGTDPPCECEEGKCACVATHNFNQCKCDGTDQSCNCEDGNCACVASHAFHNSCACEGSDPFCKECTAGLVKTSRMSKSMKKRLRKAARAAVCKCDGTDPSCKCVDGKCACVATHNFNQCKCDGTDPSCECEDGECACVATNTFGSPCSCDGADPFCTECTADLVKYMHKGKPVKKSYRNAARVAVCKCDGTDPSCKCQDGKCACVATHNFNQCQCDSGESCICEAGACECVPKHVKKVAAPIAIPRTTMDFAAAVRKSSNDLNAPFIQKSASLESQESVATRSWSSGSASGARRFIDVLKANQAADVSGFPANSAPGSYASILKSSSPVEASPVKSWSGPSFKETFKANAPVALIETVDPEEEISEKEAEEWVDYRPRRRRTSQY